ncbi:MAG: hypothetical protein PHC61_04615 [Chitinivibrionales bacterium]|nr:hypothetical protein [Chitinivibrionales bacterium]
MHKRLSIFSAVLMFLIIVGSSLSAAQTFYADDFRTLFAMPRSAAQANVIGVFDISATPNANPANLLDISAVKTRGKKSPDPMLSQSFEFAYASFFQNSFQSSILSYTTSRPDGWAVGVSAAYLYIPGIPVTENLDLSADGSLIYDSSKINMVSASTLCFNAACARMLINQSRLRFAAGAAVHALRQGLYQETGYGIGADLGASAGLPQYGVKASLLLENATTTYVRWGPNYSEEALPHVKISLGYQRAIDYLYGRIQFSYSSPDFLTNEGVNAVNQGTSFFDTIPQPKIIHPSQDPLAFIGAGCWGLEYTILSRLTFRVGYVTPGRFTGGAGIALWRRRFGLDFALLTHAELPQTYQVSARYQW